MIVKGQQTERNTWDEVSMEMTENEETPLHPSTQNPG